MSKPNLAYNKPVSASNYITPYEPSRTIYPMQPRNSPTTQRFLANTPCTMQVDLQSTYWIGSWSISHMPVLGWPDEYTTKSYKLQISLDGTSWYDADIVNNNTLPSETRTITPVQARLARLYITGGLRVNPSLCSIARFAVYEADPTSSYLTNLSISDNSLEPKFTKAIFVYTSYVSYDTDSVYIIPTAEDQNAVVKVNGENVPNGQPSQNVVLTKGEHTHIDVSVTSAVGGVTQNYNIDVLRASSPYLSDLKIGGYPRAHLTPVFEKNEYTYTATPPASITSVNITPTAEDEDASITIKCNGNEATVPSGSEYTVNLTGSTTLIEVTVNSAFGKDSKTYTITVTK